LSTTEPIVIPIEGDASDFTADAAKVNASLDKMAAHTKAAGATTTTSMKAAGLSITDLRSAYMIAADAARVAGQVWQATGQEFVNYAEQVKNMSRSLGASAEETSRLIQVADDVRVSYDTLKIAMKEAQKDGIDPNIEGLAKLADEYVKLQSPTEKTKFLLDKFGKSGMEMGKLMEKGGDGIRKMSEGISKNLLVTEEGIKASDDYQKSLDTLNESWEGLSLTLGRAFVPAMNDALNVINADITALMTFNEEVLSGKKTLGEWAGDIINNNPIKLFGLTIGKVTEAEEGFNQVLDDNSDAVVDNKEAIKTAEEALKTYKDMLEEVSQANQDAESFIQSYADFSKGYAEDHADAIEQVRDAERELAEATKEYGAESQQALDAAGNVEEARNGIQELEASWHEATNKMIYDMTLAKVSVDGLTDAEFAATQDLAVQMGIRTQAQADEAKAAMDKATALADGIAMQEDVMKEKAETDAELLRLEEEKKAAAEGTTTAIVDGSAVSAEALGTVAQAVDSATQSYQAMAQAAWDAAAAAQSAAGSSSSSGSSGGSSPDERDGSSVSSSSVSKNSTLNISIHNPRGENSASSVRRALKLTSYLGHPI